MALDRKELVSLMKVVSNANPAVPTAYSFKDQKLSYKDCEETLRNELNEIAGDYNLFQENKRLVYSLVEEILNEVVPQKILDAYGAFSEVRTFPQGVKPVFTRKLGRARAKQFITRVGLAGVYEVFRLGGSTFEMATSAIGGACQITFEEFLDGRADFAEVLAIVMEGMQDIIYREIAKALIGAAEALPEANKVATTGFDEGSMDRLIQIASAYGTPVIYCTREFAVKMIPDTNWISENMKDKMWAEGTLGQYKGIKVVVLPQSYEDETNAKKVIDPGYVWIIPTGGNDKPVKIAFEGDTHSRERENEDWSRDYQVYRKVGVGVIMTNNICSYVDTSLKGKLDTITG